jgi:hypothetical protein
VDRVFENMRRLDMRGSAGRRVAVDAEGAMLGPDCVPVRRTAAGYRPLRREDAAAIESILAGKEHDPGRLYSLSRGIGEVVSGGDRQEVEWHFAESSVADYFRAFVKQEGLAKIIVRHTPAASP